MQFTLFKIDEYFDVSLDKQDKEQKSFISQFRDNH